MKADGKSSPQHIGPVLRLTEALVVEMWKRCIGFRRTFVDIQGQEIEVIYPGRPNDSRGADFKDAVIKYGGREYSGCIELHTRISGWRSHGHQINPAYNNVVLHVAWIGDANENIHLQSGESIPTVALEDNAWQELSPRPGSPVIPCKTVAWEKSPEYIEKLIGHYGDLRLSAKAAQIKTEISKFGPDQSLYLALLEALGYSQNKRPFRELGSSAPLHTLQELMGGGGNKTRILEAFLLGKAGFLPSQRRLCLPDKGYPSQLEKIWQSIPVSCPGNVPAWELARIRPANHPVRRIAALSRLLLRFRKKGLARSLSYRVRESASDRVFGRLKEAFKVEAGSYWKNHYDFGLASSEALPHLLGDSRAAEIIINILLPFAIAFGELNSEPELVERARQIFLKYPHLTSNSIERHMLAQLGLSGKIMRTARLQQGLIQQYKTNCSQGKCLECVLVQRNAVELN
jgi:hypothetical protein